MQTINILTKSLVTVFFTLACGGSTQNAETPDSQADADNLEVATHEGESENSSDAAETATEESRPLNVPLLRSSFKLVTEREPNLTDIFYGHLFNDYPDSKELFRGVDIKTQGNMLATALSGVVDHLEEPEWLTETLGKLGQRHAGYGIKEEHYAWVGASLLKTLEQVAGADWSPALAEAWGDAYAAIQSLMLAGVKA